MAVPFRGQQTEIAKLEEQTAQKQLLTVCFSDCFPKIFVFLNFTLYVNYFLFYCFKMLGRSIIECPSICMLQLLKDAPPIVLALKRHETILEGINALHAYARAHAPNAPLPFLPHWDYIQAVRAPLITNKFIIARIPVQP